VNFHLGRPVSESKAKQILGRPTDVVYVGIIGMTRAFWVVQERVWVGNGLPGLIARTSLPKSGTANGKMHCVPHKPKKWYGICRVCRIGTGAPE